MPQATLFVVDVMVAPQVCSYAQALLLHIHVPMDVTQLSRAANATNNCVLVYVLGQRLGEFTVGTSRLRDSSVSSFSLSQFVCIWS